MATRQEQYDAQMARLNTITNDIAADYALLLKQVAEGNVTAESIEAGNGNVAILEALGASVSNPVPEPPPVEPPIE